MPSAHCEPCVRALSSGGTRTSQPAGGTLPFPMASGRRGQTALSVIVWSKTVADVVREAAV